MTDVVVVGGGHNGLCAAAYLAQAGWEVLVLERRRVFGGAAATDELVAGYRFSTCAYALHLLHERVVEELGLELDVIPLPPRTSVLPNGSVVHETDFGEQYRRWNRMWTSAAETIDRFLLGPPPAGAEVVAAARAAGVGAFADLGVSELLEQALDSPEARAVLAPTYLEGDPHAPGGPLAYAYFETGRCRPSHLKGIPRGGMGTVGAAFAAAARRAGAELRTGAEVAHILVAGGRARGVELASGERIEAKTVVSNAAVQRTLLDLVEPGALPLAIVRRLEALERGPAPAKLHLALSERPDVSRVSDDDGRVGLVHLYPSLDWYERVWPVAEAGPIELQLPTLLDESLAPPGAHCISIYLPFAPPRLEERALVDAAAEIVPNLREAIVGQALHTAIDLELRLALPHGSIHHISHAPGQVFGDRPLPGYADGRTPIEGLFLCGAGIHPGGEISGLPGRNAARVVQES